jgi:tripartite-type tricarboxylate transporter receptor subunit TctC
MKPSRRTFLQFTGAAVAAPALLRVATAQTYPSRPITMIVPGPPGGPLDSLGRVLAERMKGTLGQPVIIENVSGADSSIGVGRLARAKPDGYTIDVGYLGAHVLNGALYSLPYDLLNDFEPVSPLATSALVLYARRTIRAKDLSELTAWLKVNPGKASAAVDTAGTRLLYMLFQKETGTHFALVPYRGGAPAMQDLTAGQIDLFLQSPFWLPLVRGGSIKAYAVTSDARLVAAPDLPTFAEMGLPAVSWSAWFGSFAPKGTPKDIVTKLNAAAVEALAEPAARSRLADFGLEVFPREQQTPEALGALVKADAKRLWPLFKEFRIGAE